MHFGAVVAIFHFNGQIFASLTPKTQLFHYNNKQARPLCSQQLSLLSAFQKQALQQLVHIIDYADEEILTMNGEDL